MSVPIIYYSYPIILIILPIILNVNLSLRYSPYEAGFRTPFTTTALSFMPFVNRQVTPEIIGHAAGWGAALYTGSGKVGYAVYGYTKNTVSALMGGEYGIPTRIPGVTIPIEVPPLE